MSRIFAVDENNDLVLGPTKSLLVLTGLPAVSQACEHAAKTILNEMVLAQGEGLPYFEKVWNGAPDVPAFTAAWRRAILAVEGVTGIVSFEPVVAAGELTYVATIRTIYGDTNING